MFAVVATADPIQRWQIRTLIPLVPGSSRRTWLRDWVPQLIIAGALRKVGNYWLGRRGDIESALLSPSSGREAQR